MLRTAVSSIVFGIFSLLAISCAQNAAPVSQDNEPLSEPTADTSSEAPTNSNIDLSAPQLDTEAPTNSDIDLSVPQLDPKPLVWLDKWSGAEPVPQARRESKNLMSVADRLKANKQFQEAEEAYQKAMQADPTWGYPAYQSACNYELWNQHDRAELQFAKAVELGFDDFPTALTDDELGRVREGSGFTAALLKIRDRYVVSSKIRLGQPLAIRPGNPKPDDGWPVMLLLHQ